VQNKKRGVGLGLRISRLQFDMLRGNARWVHSRRMKSRKRKGGVVDYKGWRLDRDLRILLIQVRGKPLTADLREEGKDERGS